MAPPRPSPGAAVAFHLGGLLLYSVVGGYAVLLFAVEMFFNIGCDGDSYVPYADLSEVRWLMLRTGLVLGLFPAAWAVMARWRRFTWYAWAAWSAPLLALTVYGVTVEAARWAC